MPERDCIIVTVEINANGRRRSLTQAHALTLGQHVHIAAAVAAADTASRAALLWTYDPEES